MPIRCSNSSRWGCNYGVHQFQVLQEKKLDFQKVPKWQLVTAAEYFGRQIRAEHSYGKIAQRMVYFWTFSSGIFYVRLAQGPVASGCSEKGGICSDGWRCSGVKHSWVLVGETWPVIGATKAAAMKGNLKEERGNRQGEGVRVMSENQTRTGDDIKQRFKLFIDIHPAFIPLPNI